MSSWTDLLSTMSAVGALLVFVWAVTGAWIWLMYGWVGICYLISIRKELEIHVKEEIELGPRRIK